MVKENTSLIFLRIFKLLFTQSKKEAQTRQLKENWMVFDACVNKTLFAQLFASTNSPSAA